MLYKERIMELREEVGWKQRDVAEKLDIYKGTYNRYETEYALMPIKHLVQLCCLFDVSVDYIFGFTNIRKYKKMKKDIDKRVSGERLKSLRKSLKLTQAGLAGIWNVKGNAVLSYEKGINIISTPFLYHTCKKYGVSADYLLGRIDEPINLEKEKTDKDIKK